MESGEIELKKAFEEVTTKNVRMAIDYSKETRNLTRELQKKVLHLEEILREYDKKLIMMQNQISNIQQKLYSGGTT